MNQPINVIPSLHSSCELRESLRDILSSIPWLESTFSVKTLTESRNLRYDISATLFEDNSRPSVNLIVEVKYQPRPSNFLNIVNQLKEKTAACDYPVLAATRISPRIAELCQEHNIGWFDAAGNCHISFTNFHVERSGRESKTKAPRPKANLGTDASARVLRVILSSEYLHNSWTQSEIQPKAQVSMGLVNKVTNHLLDEAWIERNDDGKFKIVDALGLVKEWATHYRFERNRRMNFYTLLKPHELQDRLKLLSNLELIDKNKKSAFAAFSAADRYAPQVKQNKTWLYLNEATLPDFIHLSSAKEVANGENIVVLIPPDDGVYIDRRYRQKLELSKVSAIQTWLDLQHVGSRGEEAAEAMMNQYILPSLTDLNNQNYGSL